MSDRELVDRLVANLTAFAPDIRTAIDAIGPTDFPDRWRKFRKEHAGNSEKLQLDNDLTQICADIIGPQPIFIFANGGMSVDARRLRYIIEDRVASDHNIETIAAETIDLIKGEESDVFWVFGIAGIEVDAPLEIDNGVMLLPPREIPASRMREKHFGVDVDGRYIIDELPKDATAALVFHIPRERVIFKEGEKFPKGRFEDIHDLMNMIVDACVVSGADSATYVVHYIHFGHPGAGYGGLSSGYSYPITLPNHFHPDPLNRDAFVELFRSIRNLKPKMRRSMTRAIDRYRRSSWSRSPDANALDLGLAVEMMLMTDGNNDNSEIGNKICTRGAWLIGESFERRNEVFGIIRGLYRARSDAAHRGYVQDENMEFVDSARPVVMEIIRNLIAIGQFPIWNSIVLGGSRPRAEAAEPASQS